jgi:hypothetical protein
VSAAALAPAAPRRAYLWYALAIVTAATVLFPVGLRMWLKAELQHRGVPVTVYRQPISGLQVEAPGGDVNVSQGPAGRVTISGTLSWVFTQPEVTASRRGRILQVSARCTRPGPFEDCQASLAIQVPPGTAVQSSVGGGAINVTGLDGPLHLAATGGVIQMTNLTGAVWARVTSGTIAAPGGLGSARLDAQVTTGSLAVSFNVPPRQLTISVGTGSGVVTVPQGSRYRISAQRHRLGVLTLPGADDPGSPDSIAARVGTGVLTIGYPLSSG